MKLLPMDNEMFGAYLFPSTDSSEDSSFHRSISYLTITTPLGIKSLTGGHEFEKVDDHCGWPSIFDYSLLKTHSNWEIVIQVVWDIHECEYSDLVKKQESNLRREKLEKQQELKRSNESLESLQIEYQDTVKKLEDKSNVLTGVEEEINNLRQIIKTQTSSINTYKGENQDLKSSIAIAKKERREFKQISVSLKEVRQSHFLKIEYLGK
jgi:hypothetical protein